MFKKCQHCGSIFKGTGNFCSDMCEIKNYTPVVVRLETKSITPETKEELEPVKEELSGTPTISKKVAEIKEKLIQIETDLEISKKTDKSRNDQVF